MDARLDEHPTTPVREAHDAHEEKRLKQNPGDREAQLDVGLDESFPSSDPPSATRPGHSRRPAPSSGYDEAAERKIKGR